MISLKLWKRARIRCNVYNGSRIRSPLLDSYQHEAFVTLSNLNNQDWSIILNNTDDIELLIQIDEYQCFRN